jgi:hypothetical protein
MPKSNFSRLILKSHGYYIDLFKVIRDKRSILVEAMPFVQPGCIVEDGTFNKRVRAPLHKNIHWHLTYPADGGVHQKLTYFDNSIKKNRIIYANFKHRIYTLKDENNKVIKTYGPDEWFDERVFFRTGGENGSPLKDYPDNERCYHLYRFGFPVTNGYSLVSFDLKEETKVDFSKDLIVEITDLKNAVINVFSYLHGKEYSISEKWRKGSNNEILHYKLDTSAIPTIEIGLTIKENSVFYSS